VISQEELDEANGQVKAQEARLESARRDLDLLEVGTRQEQLRAQRAALAQIEAELSLVAVELEDSQLTAPFAGTVGAVGRDEGAVVAAGTPILRLVETGALEAWVGVAARTAEQLEVGSRHELRTRSGSASAAIRSILPELDPRTRTNTVILDVDDPQASGLVPGQVVHVALRETTSVENAAWLPLTALDRGERDLWSVFALVTGDDGRVRVERRDLEVLTIDTDRALVRGDLRPGESVVATGVHRLVPGEVVAPRPDAGEVAPRAPEDGAR
jgi:RND family efflux transporter MFP subunit